MAQRSAARRAGGRRRRKSAAICGASAASERPVVCGGLGNAGGPGARFGGRIVDGRRAVPRGWARRLGEQRYQRRKRVTAPADERDAQRGCSARLCVAN